MQHSYPTTVLPVTDDAMADLVSEVVIPFTRRQLADASRRTSEAAKKWKDGDSAPSLASAINLAREIPEVKWLIYSLMEVGECTFESTEVQTKLHNTLTRLAGKKDATAIIARQALQQMLRPAPAAPEASSVPRTVQASACHSAEAPQPTLSTGDANAVVSGALSEGHGG